MKIEGYEIVRELFSNEYGLSAYKVKKKGDNQFFILRLADYSSNQYGQTQDQWYELYENYQLTITNYKNLPRVSTISLLNESAVYSLVDYEEGELLKQAGELGKDEISQLIAAVRHLHSKKFVHGAIVPENIWLTSKGKVILYGAGELRALGRSTDQRYSSDIQQLVEIIRDFSLLSEEDLERMEIERPTTIDELDSIIMEAEQVDQKKVEKEKGGLVEKKRKPGKVVPTPVSVKEEKPSERKVHSTVEDKKQKEYHEEQHVEEKQKESREERRTEEKQKKVLPWMKKIGIGIVSVLALLFVIGLFADSDSEPTEVAVPVEKAASMDAGTEESEETNDINTTEVATRTDIPEEEVTVSYTKEEIAQFMNEYVIASVKAVNERDFSIVEYLIDPNGKSYQSQLEYIDYLESNNIKEDILSLEVKDYLKVDPSTYKVSTSEEFEIIYDDGSVVAKGFNSSYILKVLEDNRLVVNELLYTNEVFSETTKEANQYANEYGNENFFGSSYRQSYSEQSLDDTGAIESAVRLHYGSISNDDFTAAYNQFSSSRKKKVTKEGWEKGLQENIYDELTYVNVEQIESNKGRAYIEMTSYDDNRDGSVLVQDWAGYWNLVKENNRWTLDDPELDKVGSRVEMQ